ncbi:MAG: pyruvate, phosphate dikinase [SAR324 cluster bacterium]|nr:pyruvate, phosphate dikinase [SAR324 cluster bacterium]
MTSSSAGVPLIYPIHEKSTEGGSPPPLAVGGKGHALMELASIGAPVPSGFVCTPALSAFFQDGAPNPPEQVKATVDEGLNLLREWSGKTFGDAQNPLLLSVRSSAPAPMPEAQPTVVNIGLTPDGVDGLIRQTNDARLAWDAYRRFIHSYGMYVLGVEPGGFDQLLAKALAQANAEADHELHAEALEALAKGFREHCESQAGCALPSEPREQLYNAVAAGFKAWNHPRAVDHRRATLQEHLPGTAMVVQEMVFGTGAAHSGAGSLFTRHPASGKKKLYGKFLERAYVEDLTAGVRFTEDLSALGKLAPKAYKELKGWAEKIERHFHDAQEIQFTIDEGRLMILQSRPAGRTAAASIRIALDLVDEGICNERDALCQIDPVAIDLLLHPTLDKSGAEEILTKGVPASPGSAVGQVVFFAEQVEEMAAQGVKTILVRQETTPEDIGGLSAAEGILTAHGGLTSHAAVVARGMGKCCIVGAQQIDINYHINEMTIGEKTVKRMDWISLDGNTGEIFAGQLPQVQPSLEGDVARVMEWADRHRSMGVRANADTEADARKALEMGAEGVGLCRTEHMFFDIERIPIFRKMILSVDEIGRSAALAELLPMQRKDFMEIFRVMQSRPVTIRLLDPPLHEFLPRSIRSQTRMSKAMNISVEMVQHRSEALSETNPMLGHRGCRLAFTYPEIYHMQVRAIVEAACIVAKEGVAVQPEIMVPLVSTARELALLRESIRDLADRVMEELAESLSIQIGTMLETPRAAVCSRSIAAHADFYSFGTNDLTQMGFGFSRDDSGSFLPMYMEKGVLEEDPFVALDQEGIGAMMRIAIEEGRKSNPDLKVGICGEHGGEAASVKFFHKLGLDYVSCSPFRLPIARLAAAQAAIEMEEE